MDRMDFINNRIDPCARQPYRIALREKGFAPGCKLHNVNIVVLELIFDNINHQKLINLSCLQIFHVLIGISYSGHQC